MKLTPRGREMADRAIAVHFERLDNQLAALTRSERKDMAGLLS